MELKGIRDTIYCSASAAAKSIVREQYYVCDSGRIKSRLHFQSSSSRWPVVLPQNIYHFRSLRTLRTSFPSENKHHGATFEMRFCITNNWGSGLPFPAHTTASQRLTNTSGLQYRRAAGVDSLQRALDWRAKTRKGKEKSCPKSGNFSVHNDPAAT